MQNLLRRIRKFSNLRLSTAHDTFRLKIKTNIPDSILRY